MLKLTIYTILLSILAFSTAATAHPIALPHTHHGVGMWVSQFWAHGLVALSLLFFTLKLVLKKTR